GSTGRRGKTADRGGGRPRENREQTGPEQSMRSYDRYEVEAHLDELEAHLGRVRTERDEAIAHGEDLGYQVEVLRSKLHELRRNNSGPNYNNISGQVDQMLRNAQAQADQVRSQAQQEAQRFQADFEQRRRSMEAELAERRQRGEA